MRLYVHLLPLDYLSVGVAVHHFNPEDSKYGRTVVEQTLESLVNKTSTYEKLHNFIAVIISRKMSEQNESLLVRMIVRKFLYEINIGFIHIILLPLSRDMNLLLPALNCNVVGALEHITTMETVSDEKIWNVHPCIQLEFMLYMWSYAKSLSENYLHMDDSMEAVRNVIGSVREFIKIQKANSKNWGLLEFYNVQFLGNVMHSQDIVKFVEFFARARLLNSTFEMMVDLYCRLLSQTSRLLRTPEVFQSVSSTQRQQEISGESDGDVDETRFFAEDPPGIVLSNMNHIGIHIPSLVYGSKVGYFKALMPQVGDWIVIVFDDDVVLQRIRIRTGEKMPGIPNHNSLSLVTGVVEVSPKVLRLDTSNNFVTCADFVKIGDVGSRVVEISNFTKLLWGRTTKCLKLTVTDVDDRDIIFHQIAVN